MVIEQHDTNCWVVTHDGYSPGVDRVWITEIGGRYRISYVTKHSFRASWSSLHVVGFMTAQIEAISLLEGASDGV